MKKVLQRRSTVSNEALLLKEKQLQSIKDNQRVLNQYMRVKKMQFQIEKKNQVKITRGDNGIISEIKDKSVASKKRRKFASLKDSGGLSGSPQKKCERAHYNSSSDEDCSGGHEDEYNYNINDE